MQPLTRLIRLIRLGAALYLAVGLANAARTAEPLEYAVKAAYLSKFGFYVEWPADAFGGAAGPLTLCVVGDDPFGGTLDEAVAGQQVGGRAIAVRRLKSVSRESGCHIVYVGSETRPGAVGESLRGSPALVVTDSRNPSAGGSAIQFVLKDNRVRFTIDDEAAAQNRLGVSSKLLNLALSVKPREAR
jgi:hypothetical protein